VHLHELLADGDGVGVFGALDGVGGCLDVASTVRMLASTLSRNVSGSALDPRHA
jgi:hypothetical protein